MTSLLCAQALSGFTGTMANAHQYPALVLLNDGRALAADGIMSELYNPATNTWTTTPSMNTTRNFHRLVTLVDGRVLAVGGAGGTPYTYFASAELFAPQTKTWTSTGPLNVPRGNALSTRLAELRRRYLGHLPLGRVHRPARHRHRGWWGASCWHDGAAHGHHVGVRHVGHALPRIRLLRLMPVARVLQPCSELRAVSSGGSPAATQRAAWPGG